MSRWFCARAVWVLCAAGAIAAMLAPLPVLAGVASMLPADQPASIRVVGDKNYPPYLFVDANGKPQGYEVDLWRLFEQHTGIKVELLPVDWTSVQPDLLAGRADVVAFFYRTPSREASFDFSAPYVSQQVGIFTDRRIRGTLDVAALREFPVGVERGGVCADKLTGMGFKELRAYASYKEVVDAAVQGRLLVFCMSADIAYYQLNRESALARFNQALTLPTSGLHFAVRKGNTRMLQTVERGMALITPAERAVLQKRWLERPSPATPYLHTVKIVLAVVAVTIALMALWVWLLRRSVVRRTGELQAERDKLRALFDASPDGMWVKDRDGVHRECNDRVAGLLHVQRNQLIGHTDAEAFGAERAALAREMDAEVMRLAQQRTFVFALPDGADSARQIEVVKAPLRSTAGEINGVLSVARDITDRVQVEERLRMWGHAFQHAAFGVAVFDARTQCIVLANPVFARERGYTPETLAGKSVDVLYPEDILEERRAARCEIDRRDHSLLETEHVARDGRRFPVLLDISVTHDAEGKAQYVIVYAQDISARKRAEGELRLAAIAFESQEPLIVFAADGTIQRVNRAFTRASGYAPDEVIGRPASIFKSRKLGQIPMQELLDTVRAKGVWQGERWTVDKRGQSKIIRCTISAVRGEGGEVTHFLYAAVDLTSEREAHANVDRMTYFDPLTDLPNRGFLYGRLQQHMDDAHSPVGALLLFDLDHFKRVNDLRGHSAGDRLLVLVARRLRDALGGKHLLCRFGGGTFAVMEAEADAEPVMVHDQAQRCAERLQEALRQPFDLGGDASVAITASVGWTELVPGKGSAETVLREAELAMYEAKAAGRDQMRRYAAAMQAELVRKEELVGALRRAIAEGSFDLHMQAQVDRQGTVVGAEGLLRWTRTNGESISPAVFIPLAEDSGLIVPLGNWVLQHACVRLAAWSAQPHTRGLSLAVNVSAKQFARPDFTDGVRSVLEATGANPARLKLEITESAIVDDLADVAEKLRELRALGIRVSLDDFGTGYSSLAYLARLPLDQLKIDQSFVARLLADANDAMVAQSIVGMGRGLGLEVIAEGVETEAQWRFLMDQGCDAFQGYLFARPVPCAVFEATLAERMVAA